MNNTDFVIHIRTENDTLLGRLESESNDIAIEDVNRVRRFIIGAFVVFAALLVVVVSYIQN